MIASKEEEEIPSLEIYAMAQRVKRLSAMQETRVRSLGWEDPPWRRKWQPIPVLLPGKIPRLKEPGRLYSMGSQRVGHD